MTNAAHVRLRRRDAVLEPICDHLLAHGLGGSNLRALARAADTSDRMLLYYFADKNDLIDAALRRLGQRLADRLAERTPNKRMVPNQLADAVWTVIREPDLWAYKVLFVELVARSARVGEPYSGASRAITEHVLEWVSSRLATADDVERSKDAMDVLAIVDGRVLLQMALPDANTV